MVTTHLFVIANVKQLRTDGSFRILLPFFLTSWGVGILNTAIFNSFHNQAEIGTILEGFWNFGGGGVEPLQPPPPVHHKRGVQIWKGNKISIDYNRDITFFKAKLSPSPLTGPVEWGKEVRGYGHNRPCPTAPIDSCHGTIVCGQNELQYCQ